MQPLDNGEHRTSQHDLSVVPRAAAATAPASGTRRSRLVRSVALLLRRYRAELRTSRSDGPVVPNSRAQLDELIGASLDTIVDCFHRSNEQVHRAEQEREFWRDQLIRFANPQTRVELRGGHAIVRIRATTTRDIPRAGSTQRVELERRIREAGQWDAFSELSRSKLVRALCEHRLERSGIGAIEELCPSRIAYTVTSRPLPTNPMPESATDAS